jgi:hypothetical protein
MKGDAEIDPDVGLGRSDSRVAAERAKRDAAGDDEFLEHETPPGMVIL